MSSQLSPTELDALREVANVGAGTATFLPSPDGPQAMLERLGVRS